MNSEADDFDPFAAGEISRTAPITPEQEELWLSVQLGGTPANLAYNQATALRFQGPLDQARLQASLDQLLARHEALRMTLSADGASLCVSTRSSFPWASSDLSQLSAEERDAEHSRLRRAAVLEPFDLIHGPLARARLIVLGERDHVLLLVAHHLICDGWSSSLLVDELAQLYSAGVGGTRAEFAPATPFSEYAALRQTEARSAEAARDRQYWKGLYRAVPAPLELPLDRPRAAERSFAADRLDFPLPAPLIRELRSVAGRHGASLATLLFAAFQCFVQRISGQRSFSIVMPAAGQSICGDSALVGHCVRSLPIRAEVDPKRPFCEHVISVKRAVLDALDHPRITFGGLVKELPLTRDASHIPLSSVMFNVDSNVTRPRFAGLEVAVQSLPRAYESFELFVSIGLCGDEAVIEACYNSHLFERQSLQNRLAEFQTLLADVAHDATRSVGELQVVAEQEREQVLEAINRTQVELPTRTLIADFQEVARRHPERTAVCSGQRSLSYQELDRASAALARQLISEGVGHGSFVGVLVSRTTNLLVTLLGILRSGAAYVPLDPDYPPQRLAFIVDDARLALIVTERGLEQRLPAGPRALFVDELGSESTAPLDRSRLGEPAYVIYTSGSTGKPKGVVVEHRNVANFLTAMRKRPGIAADDVMIALTTPSFDISLLELLLPLMVGAKVVIASQEQVADGRLLARLIEEAGGTIMQATPAGWRLLIESGWQGQNRLKALSGGEALSIELGQEIQKRTASLWNCYGPTETTIWSTIERMDGSDVTIGRPIDNTAVYVLDAALRPVPPGVTGELFIGGAGVARGYFQRPELDAERFVHDPFAGAAEARMYKTGDLARLRWDGRLEWLGRSDFQVKVRGHRIELGEIEARLAECSGVLEGVAIVREDRPGDQRLVGYVRPSAEPPSEHQLREQLFGKLPAYMIPQHVVVLSSFPLTPNGKIDRKALPAPEAQGAAGYRAAETEVEQLLAREYADLSGAARVGLDDDFFALGGHSMLALKLVGRVQALFGVELPMRVVFSSPTLKGLSDYVEAALVVQRGSGVRPVAGPSEREEVFL